MKKIFYLIKIITILYIILTNNSYAQKKYDNYKNYWQSVDSLASKGLNQLAQTKVMEIYNKAKNENNPPQLVKAIIHKLKFESFYNENYFEENIDFINKNINELQEPTTNILHSIIADLYWNYYQNNRWLFKNRSITENYNNNDIKTWDLKKIVEKTLYHYLTSLRNTEILQKTPLYEYDEILVKQEGSKTFRPTLYDFLAHKAIDFLMNEEPDLIKPAYEFQLNNKEDFAFYDKFITNTYKTDDTLSLKYHAIKILQELIKFHINDPIPTALIDVDLKRLNFVRKNSIHPEKDELYLTTLEQLKTKNKDYNSVADVYYAIAKFYYDKGNNYNPFTDNSNRWYLKKAAETCNEAINKYPETDGATNCKSLKTQIENPHFSISISQATPPNKPILASVSYKNIDKLHIKIVKVNPEWLKKIHRKKWGEELIKELLNLTTVASFEQKLPTQTDYQSHTVDIKVPPLPNGFYAILASPNQNFDLKNNAIAYAYFWITNISFASRNLNNGEIEFVVVDRSSGKPLKNITVEVWNEKYNYKNREYEFTHEKSFKTDNNGFVIIPATSDYRSFTVIFKDNNDIFFSNNTFYQYKNYNEKEKKIVTHFFTDRQIYRPGQTIYFKGIILETDGDSTTIKTNFKTTITFYDANNQKISETTLVTNEYGTINGHFIIPQGLLTGDFRIDNGSGNINIKVEEYKRPKFETYFDKIKGTYKLNDTIKIAGYAKTYTGTPVTNAKVRYRVYRNAIFPYWWFYYKGYHPISPEVEITNGFTNTDEDGKYDIKFIAIPDFSIPKTSEPRFTYKVIAEVTDINGETQVSQTSITVGYKALLLSIEIPPSIEINDKHEYKINTTNLAGNYEFASGTIEIYRLKEEQRLMKPRQLERPDTFLMSKQEFISYFPNEVYDNEDNYYKWERNEKVLSVNFNTEKDSILKFERINTWKPGMYQYEIKSKDRYGEEVKEIGYFELYNRDDKKLTLYHYEWCDYINLTAEPGEKAKFIWGTKAKDIYLLYEIEKDAKIVDRKWLNLSDEKKTFEILINENDRGNFSFHLFFVKDGKAFTRSATVVVPYSNKNLTIEYSTFRDKLSPGQEETWNLKIKGPKKEKIAAEMLASMYDASLDAFVKHEWIFNYLKYRHATLNWNANLSYSIVKTSLYTDNWLKYDYPSVRYYDELNWFGFYYYYRGSGYSYYHMVENESYKYPPTGRKKDIAPMSKSAKWEEDGLKAVPTETTKETVILTKTSKTEISETQHIQNLTESKENITKALKVRTNFNETAFFYPQLHTNEEGDVIIKFTIPETLTKWKFRTFAHTKDLKFIIDQKEIITQKELMVFPNTPRFFREGDDIILSTKITNTSDKEIKGDAYLLLFDPITMNPLDYQFANVNTQTKFTISPKQNISVNWKIKIPHGYDAVNCRIIAKTDNFSDGEEIMIPILSNRILVTETLPLPIRGKTEKNFTFEKLIKSNNSSSLIHHKLTLEFTNNPAWFAIQALPYILEYPYDCNEQIFNRYYANSIARHIANSNPKIKAVFESWKNITPDALLSNLEKNQELKSILLEETPWVLAGKNESERKKRISLLFDLNKMSSELEISLRKLIKNQSPNGGWPWFPGMPDDRFITQYIITGFTRLEKMNIIKLQNDKQIWEMITKAIYYLDNKIKEDYEWLIKNYKKEELNKNNLSPTIIQYLYARSYFFKQIDIYDKCKEAVEYYIQQCKKYWTENNRYLQGMIALSLNRLGDKQTAMDIIKSLKNNSITSEEFGMYWKDMNYGYYWFQAPIETQALLIEAFDEVANDINSIEEMKVWLIKQKQTTDWKTTKATADACYALLMQGTNWLEIDEKAKIQIGNNEINPYLTSDNKIEAGSGYFKISWNKDQITPEMGKIKISKQTEGVSWGAMYWQYFEQVDKITPAQTPLKINKQLFVEKNTPTGPVITPVNEKNPIKVGDKIKVRIEIRTDRDLEYVHLKDMRASGLEPTNVISQYKYQGGIGYYESTRDAATNFFINYLHKGTYVFEYSLYAAHEGDFSNGITSIQCMYAPEFASHTEGIRINIIK